MDFIDFIKKLFQEILNCIKAFSLAILGFFLKSPEKEKNVKKDDENNSTETATGASPIIGNNDTALPDDINSKNNPHSDTDTTNSIILELPKTKLEQIKKHSITEDKFIITEELICELIEEELDRIYKDRNLKIKKLDERFEAEKELLKTIKKFEEKIVPIIEKEVNFYHLDTEEEVKKTVNKVVEVEIKEFHILPPLKVEIDKVEKKDEVRELSPSPSPIKEETSIELPKTKEKIYSIAYQKERSLNIPEDLPQKIERKPIITVEDKNEFKDNLTERKVVMVKNTEEIPKPTLKDTAKNITAASTMVAIKTATEILAPTPTKEPELPKKDEKLEILEKQLEKEPDKIEELENIKKEIEIRIEEIKEEEKKEELEQKQVESPTAEQKKKEEQKREQRKQDTKEKEELAKSLIRDTEIGALAIETNEVIEDSKNEINKEDFFDKDYDRIEAQINRMLEDITNTKLRYGNKLSPKQKGKLEREESKLREAKEHIASQKSKDIEYEQKQLTDYITDEELFGLQNELKKIDEQNKEEVSEEYLKRMEKLQGMTQDQVAQADKRILFKRLNKASLLLEMGSILAFPFIHNRYFFNFTLGLIINNHFNFINAFWRRKMNRYEPADLSSIKQGQDALNGALDITFQNIIELDQIEQDALNRYPELANDPRFVNQVTNLRIRLNNNYNQLMRRNKLMETYYGKTKRQTRVLKKDLRKEKEQTQ